MRAVIRGVECVGRVVSVVRVEIGEDVVEYRGFVV